MARISKITCRSWKLPDFCRMNPASGKNVARSSGMTGGLLLATLLLALGSILVTPVNAQVPINAGQWTNLNWDDGSHVYTYSVGGTETLNGNFTINPGSQPSITKPIYTWQTDGDAESVNYVTPATRLPDDYLSHPTLLLGAQSSGVLVPHPTNPAQGNVTYNVYNNANFEFGATGSTFNPNVTSFRSGAAAGIYSALRLATVTSGTLNVEVTSTVLGNNNGAAIDPLGNAANGLYAKDVALFAAENTGTVVLNRDMAVFFINPNNYTASADLLTDPLRTINTTTTEFKGAFTAFDGTTKTVTDIASLRAYNTFLITALGNGSLQTTDYNAEFAKAFTNTTYTVQYNGLQGAVDASDIIFTPVTKNVIAQADGPDATVRITSGVNVLLNAYTTSYTNTNSATLAPFAALYGTNGGTIINDGLIAARLGTGSNNFTGAYSMLVDSGAEGINNGVIATYPTTFDGGGKPLNVGLRYMPVGVTGAGSTFTNNGIINVSSAQIVATTFAHGITVRGAGTAVNHGAINVGIAEESLIGDLFGAHVTGSGSSFTNLEDGVIYIGRGPSVELAADPINRGGADIPISVERAAGVYANQGSSARNEGTIVLGSETVNAYGMYAENVNSSITNAGLIDIRGGTLTSKYKGTNNGLYATGLNVVANNTGMITIEQDAINSIALHLVAGARGTSSGVINVNGGFDTATGLRNYGIVAEGVSGTAQSTATLSGELNLNGDGAIGVFVRDRGQVNIVDDGRIVFDSSASDQIGYYVYGAGSAVNIDSSATATVDVTSANSVLYRMEAGADFVGGSGATAVLTASGDGSTAVVVTGATGTDLSTFNSGGMTINTSGVNSTGVRVEGGAQGLITSAATIDLEGTGSIAGVVDGRSIALNGAASTATAASTLTNEATITSTTDGVTAFITRYDGTLINNGVITLNSGTGNTGIIAQNGGNLDNRKDITVENGTGVLIDGAGSASGFTNSATIHVNDGVAGLVIRNGASVTATGLGDGSGGAGNITADGTAHGVLVDTGAASVRLGANTIQALGTGSGIENAGEISAVSFAGTTIVAGNGAAIRTATSFDATPASTATLTVTGAGTGFLFQKADGTAASGNLALGSGYTITVDGSSGTSGGTGVLANSTGTVANAATVRVTDALGGSAVRFGTAVTGGSNSGTLASAST
ncbi:MAG: hypothetical protein LBG44_03200, partial [Gemmatimonadota bacterium]|nr:hypothetical protein [Gemmatimonadota bacterium]